MIRRPTPQPVNHAAIPQLPQPSRQPTDLPNRPTHQPRRFNLRSIA